jgi:Peptidase S46
MKRCMLFVALLGLFISANTLFADEGMWPYNLVPKDKIKAKYGVDLSPQFLDHLRLASVRTGGGSASFVSPDGLVFTNHHVGAGCVHNLSTATKDYIKDGFFAPTRADEPKCPGIEFTSLLDIKDITKDVQEAGRGLTDAEAAAAQRQVMAKLEKDCSDPARNIRCETITLYSGGMYHLYKYKKYTDVRLVMAPEFDIAFFGGDADNFTYPRYDLDITFFRIYENDKPLKVDHYLTFTTTPVKENDLIFVSGHPGSTGRLQTMAQLELSRDVIYPFRINSLKRNIALLKDFSAKSAENERDAERVLFGAQNSFKATTGYLSGLLDASVMAKKAADEKALRDAVMADPKLKEVYGNAWDEIAKAVKYQRDNYVRYTFTEGALPGRLAQMARMIVRVAEEKTKPNEKRLRGFQDQVLPTVEQQLFSAAPIYKDIELMQYANALEELQAQLGKDDDLVKAFLGGKSAADRAAELVNGTKLNDIAVRKELYAGGKAAIEASTDPLIVLMRNIDPTVRDIRKKYEDNVDAVIRKNGTLIAKARFAKYGTAVPPDATGTLRFSYGQVKSYSENGRDIHYHTTIGEAFTYSEKHGNKTPYKLPDSWIKAKPQLDLNTSLDSVNTTDIIGGNSGSPAVNKNGEIVGIIFDGNIQSLPWNVMYDDTVGRSVITDSPAVVETLRKVYKATSLADELLANSKSAVTKANPAEKKPAASADKVQVEKNAALPATR